MLLVDEPSAGLAPAFVDAIFEKLVEINQRRRDDPDGRAERTRALAMSDRGYVLDLGKNRFTGPGKELIADPKVAELYLGGGGPRLTGPTAAGGASALAGGPEVAQGLHAEGGAEPLRVAARLRVGQVTAHLQRTHRQSRGKGRVPIGLATDVLFQGLGGDDTTGTCADRGSSASRCRSQRLPGGRSSFAPPRSIGPPPPRSVRRALREG